MVTTSVTLPGDPRAIELLRALRGAPLSCLHALRIAHPTPLDRTQLCMMTNYKKDEVTEAMRLLCDLYGFATRLGRYAGWILTQVGAQLHLPGIPAISSTDSNGIRTDVPRALGEGDFSAFPPSSSSGFISIEKNELVQTTTTTPSSESDFSAFPPEASALIGKFLRGCKRAVAENAVRAALERGDSLDDIEIEMISWVLYGESPLGKGIRSAAIHAAARIKNGEKCPEFLFRVNKKDKHDGDTWAAWEQANEEWIRRLEELRSEPLQGWMAGRDGPPNGKLFRRELLFPRKFAEQVEQADLLDDNVAAADTAAEAETTVSDESAPRPARDARAVEIWNNSLNELQLQMTKATFDTWVKPAFAISYDRERSELVIGVRNPYAKQWLENRLYGMIERTVRHVIGIATRITFTQVMVHGVTQ